MSYAVHMLRAGRTHDRDCWHASHRLALATQLLKAGGAEAVWPEHGEDCARTPARLANTAFGWRDRVCCTCGRDSRGPQWPAWVTNEMLAEAYDLADAMQTARGGWHQAEIDRKRRERV